MFEPIISGYIQQLDGHRLHEMIPENTLTYHQIIVGLNTNKVAGILAYIQSIQQNVASDFSDVAISL